MKTTLLLLALASPGLLQAADTISAQAPGLRAQISADGKIDVIVKTDDDTPLVSIENSRQDGRYDCAGRNVSVSGKHNRLALTGDCPFVDVSGDDNQIVIDKLGELSVAGDNNTVLWRDPLAGDQPDIGDDGDDNRIEREPKD